MTLVLVWSSQVLQSCVMPHKKDTMLGLVLKKKDKNVNEKWLDDLMRYTE